MPLFVGASESYDTDAWEAYDLKKENAKMRELIRTMWLAGDFRAFLGADEIKEHMRELGIEVPHD